MCSDSVSQPRNSTARPLPPAPLCLTLSISFVFRQEFLLSVAVFLLCGVAECITAMKIATPPVTRLRCQLSRCFRWSYRTGAIAKAGNPRISSCRTQQITSLQNATWGSRRFATGVHNLHNRRYLHALIATIFLICWFGTPNALREVSSAMQPSAGRTKNPRMRGRRRL